MAINQRGWRWSSSQCAGAERARPSRRVSRPSPRYHRGLCQVQPRLLFPAPSRAPPPLLAAPVRSRSDKGRLPGKTTRSKSTSNRHLPFGSSGRPRWHTAPNSSDDGGGDKGPPRVLLQPWPPRHRCGNRGSGRAGVRAPGKGQGARRLHLWPPGREGRDNSNEQDAAPQPLSLGGDRVGRGASAPAPSEPAAAERDTGASRSPRTRLAGLQA